MKRRGGRTEKISISLDREDLRLLRRRADQLHAGNLSAAVSEGIQRLREELGRQALAEWLGAAGRTTAAARDRIRTEWRGKSKA